jgi:D-serine deaminase-like pyridoxal phosphate-dependent protein
VDTAEAIRAAGIPVQIVSCGGTGTFLNVRDIPGVTEVQAGGGIFGDGFYRSLDVPVEPALSLMVTVTSRPAPDRVIFDAGRKSVDPSNRAPEVPELASVTGIALSAEHGTIRLGEPCEHPRIGDRLRLHIGYSDQAVHLHEQLIAVRDEQVVAIWPTETRGRLQ